MNKYTKFVLPSLFMLGFLLALLGTAWNAAAAPRSGTIDVIVEDYEGGTSREVRYFVSDDGRTILPHVTAPRNLLTGSRVIENDGVLTVTEAAYLSGTVGEQRVAVMLVNFSDNTTEPITPGAASSLVFGQVNNYYTETSFDRTWLTGDVHGYYTIPLSRSVCDYYELAYQADAAATADGVDLSTYQRRLYMFPRNACGWSGIAQVGGYRAWINGAFTMQVVAHELGHNQGLSHARSRDCGSVTLCTPGAVSEYGDVADLMGAYRAGHVGPHAKEMMGWLNDGVGPPIHLANATGRYVIEPYSSATTGPKALKIPRGLDAGGKQLWYYLEYRQPIGADAVLANDGNLTSGLMLRLATENDRYSNHLLDTTPSSQSSTLADFRDGALAPGHVYREEAVGVQVEVAWIDASGAAVDVTIGDLPPPPPPPPPPPEPDLALAVTTDKSSYTGGQHVLITSILTNEGAPVPGVSVGFQVRDPKNRYSFYSGTTDANGITGATHALGTGKGKTPTGTWAVIANASYNGASTSDTTTFLVTSSGFPGKGGKR